MSGRRVIRLRNMSARRLMSQKWRRTVATVDWLMTQFRQVEIR
jgi:hypothetical protein